MKKRDKTLLGLNSIFIKFNLAAVLLVISITLSACTSKAITKQHFLTQGKSKYKTEKVQRGSISYECNCGGTIISSFQQNLFFKIGGGYLKSLNIIQGDRVKKGDILGECECPELESQIKDQEAKLKIAELDYESLKSRGADGYDLKMAEYNIEMEKVAAAKLRDKLSEKYLISNINGIVTYVNNMKIGNPVTPYSTMVIISDTEHLLVEYTGDNVGSFKVGMKAQIEYKGCLYNGRVVSSSTVADKNSLIGTQMKTALISIEKFDNKNAVIGDSIKLCIEIMKKDKVLKIPFNALHSYNNSSYVYVLEKGVKTERTVVVGLANSSELEIISGLKEGEEVIID